MQPADRETNAHAATQPNGSPQSTESTRAAINRANAQHSTGPRTEAGKKRSSLNALRHGLTGHVIVLPSDDLTAYQAHVQSIFDQFQPQGPFEKDLVQTLADLKWRLERIFTLEENLLTHGFTEHSDAVNTADPQIHASLAIAHGYREQSRTMANLSIHEGRLSRRHDQLQEKLRQMQAQRREKEQQDLVWAADFLEKHEKEGTPYDPSEDGFVFTIDEIETYSHRRARRNAVIHKTPLPASLKKAALPAI